MSRLTDHRGGTGGGRSVIRSRIAGVRERAMGSTDDAELGPVGITKSHTTKSAISHPGCGAHYRV